MLTARCAALYSSGAAGNDVYQEHLRELQDKFTELANKHLIPNYQKADPNLKWGYRGSFGTGIVGNLKKSTFGQPTNLSDFDVDFWIESNILYKRYGRKLMPNPDFRDLLENTSGFEGLRPGRKGFTIRFSPVP